LRAKTDEFRNIIADRTRDIPGETELRQEIKAVLEELLPEAFAAVREASKRTIGLRHYDVQLVGGIVLHQGKIAEMRTGEKNAGRDFAVISERADRQGCPPGHCQ